MRGVKNIKQIIVFNSLLLPAIVLLGSQSFKCKAKKPAIVKTEHTISTADSNLQNANSPIVGLLPPNWPWRGVSLQSEKSDYKDVSYLKMQKINFIRIQLKVPVRAKKEKTSPQVAFKKELNWAEEILNACKQHNITALIAFNHLVFDPEDKVTDKTEQFWNTQKYLDSTYKYVDFIAEKFKSRGEELSGYEVISEPAIAGNGLTGGKRPEQIEDFFKTILKTIRKYDLTRYFLLTPGPWGRPSSYEDFKGFNIKDSRIIYGAHMYMPHEFTHQGVHGRSKGIAYPGRVNRVLWDKNQVRQSFADLKKFEKDHNVLIYVGEFSAARWSKGRDQYLKDVVDVMEEYGFSWTYFTYKSGINAWDPFYEVINLKEDPKNWKVNYIGEGTSTWLLLKNYFQKNNFTIK